MSERPQVLDQLGLELERVARRTLADSGRMGSTPRRVSAIVVIVGFLVLAAAATAAVLLIRQGPALPAPHAQDLQSSGVPLPGSARLAGLDAPDPEHGALPWDVRLSQTSAGETCTAVGQVLGGRFGIVGLDHVFRALPLGGVDSCGVSSPAGPILAGAREFVGRKPEEARTVVNGVAGVGARSVIAFGPDGARQLRLGPEGSFLTVYRGSVEEVRPRIVVVTHDGHSHTVSFAQSPAFETADPGGGSPWTVDSEADLEANGFPDEDCVQANPELGPADPSHFSASLTPEVCGRLATQPLFVSMRRFVPGSGAGTGWPWGNNPARTLVYGVAAPRVSSLILSGAGSPHSLPIDPHGGAFIAVLSGHVDPRSLTLTARLANGSTLTYSHSANLLEYRSNRPLAETAVPAYRNPLPPAKTVLPAFELPVRSTVRETLRAKDPVGGPTWVLRTWQGTPNPRANFGGETPSGRFQCIELGVVRGGSLVEPGVGTRAEPLHAGGESGHEIPGEESGRCNEPKSLTRMRYMLQFESYLGDLYSYAPHPARTILDGMLPLGSTDAMLLGLGAPRSLPLDPNGAFLVVLPGRYWDASPHITYRLHGRLVGRGPGQKFPLGSAPSVPQSRAPDPDGGAPWGFAATASCSTAIGRIVDGRLTTIDERNGVLTSGPSMTGSSSSCNTRPGLMPMFDRSKSVEFDVQPVEDSVALPGREAEPLSRPEIERRTLPGRTIITGIARPDVTSITISTPRDVRTLRPAGPLHTVIAVYDGEFYGGAITARIKLRNGHIQTETVLNPADLAGVGDENPSPQTRLRADERQLAQVRAARRRGPTAGNTHPHSRGAPRAGVVEILTTDIRAVRRRMAYEHAHPGVLPSA